MSTPDNWAWQPPAEVGTTGADGAAPDPSHGTTQQPGAEGDGHRGPASRPGSAATAGQPAFGAYGTPPPGQAAGGPGWSTPQGAQYGPAAGQYGPAPGQYGPAAGQYGPAAPAGFVLAPKPGIIPLRPLSLGEILEGAFQSLRVNPRAMFLPSLLVNAVIGGLAALAGYLLSQVPVTSSGPDGVEVNLQIAGAQYGSSTINLLFTVLAAAVLSGLLIVAVSRAVLGRLATPGEVWERTKPRVWALIGETLLVQVLTIVITVVLGLIAVAIVAGIGASTDFDSAASVVVAALAVLVIVVVTLVLAFLVGIRLSLAPAALVLENLGVIESMKRSWSLTRGFFWRILGITLLVQIIVGLISGMVGGVIGLIQLLALAASPDAMGILMAVTAFLTALVQAVVLPFSAAVTALIYIDVRMRKEGLDVELRRAAEVE